MIEVVVVRKQYETPNICTLQLALPSGGLLPPFTAGAHIDVRIGETVRQYSLCNSQEERQRYLIGVLKDPNSRGGSIGLHENVHEGDRIQISEPRNHFPLVEGARRVILIAGGIGVTPILCMAERLAQIGADFTLHYCARSEPDAAFLGRMRQSRYQDRISFHFDDGAAEQRFDVDSVLASPDPDTHVYVCGPSGFMDCVSDSAARLGWPAVHMHREYFAAPAIGSPQNEFEVEISSTGQVVLIPCDRTVVAVLADHGVYIPTGCDQGVCGTCLTTVLEGEPDHRDVVMDDAQHAANDQFTPCCSRAKSRRLVLGI